MTPPCIPVEELGILSGLGDDDPRRQHVTECSRCRARWLDYQSFLSAGRLPPEADERRSVAALEAFITREIGDSPEETRGRVRTFRRAVLPRWWPAVAAAAMATVVVTLVVPRHHEPLAPVMRPAPSATERVPRPRETQSPGILRGPSATERVPLALEPPDISGEGRLTLRWRPLPGADAYEVHLYRADLSEVFRTPETPETTVSILRSMLPDDASAGTPLLWRVSALRGGAEIKRSDVGHLRAP